MSYLVNQARLHSLFIDGADNTDKFISWTVSDASAYKRGLLETTGTVVLGQKQGDFSINDYTRNRYKRGTSVLLNVQWPDGTVERHPRGLLYVLSDSYSPETEELTLEIGCILSLAALTEGIDELLPLVPLPLDATQETYANVSASFASAGKYLFQDNQGALVQGDYFGTDTESAKDPGEWVSVLGTTALSVQPLAGTQQIPDEILLTYRAPQGLIAGDQQGRVDTVTTKSYYYVTYPAVVYQRQGNGQIPGSVAPPVTVTPATSGCGNTPPQPDSGGVSCSDGYVTVQTPLILPAEREEIQVTYYDGPGAQVSRVNTKVYGPSLEANTQYYADEFAYCRYTWASACNPNGSCPTNGTSRALLQESDEVYSYGNANELVSTTVDVYQTVLSGSQPFNWRSGVVNGAPQNFTTQTPDAMYRQSSTTTSFSVDTSGATVEDSVTWTSVTARSSGTSGNIDALDGFQTRRVRRSATLTVNPLNPPTVNSPSTTTVDAVVEIPLFAGRYKEAILEAGPYIANEQIPVPLLLESSEAIDNAVFVYSNYLSSFVKGDSFGLTVGEGLRQDVCDGWRPGMPFRYADPGNSKIYAMRMDATNWGVDRDGAAVVTNGIWIGQSNGELVVPDNLRGNSRTDGTPAGDGGSPPSIESETTVDAGAFAFVVNVHINLGVSALNYGNVYLAEEGYTSSSKETLRIYVSGDVFESDSLISPDANGSMPIDNGGVLMTTEAELIQANIFG